MDTSYYIAELLRKPNAFEARKYLGIQNANGENLLTNFDSAVVTAGYVTNQTPLWNDVRVPLAGAGPGSSPPTFSNFVGGIKAWRFDNAAPEESLHFEIQVPHGFNKDSSLGIRLHLHWSCQHDMTGLGTVEWNIECSFSDLEGNFGAPATYSNTGATTAANQHVETDLHTFTGLSESAIIIGRLYRTIGDSYADSDVFALSLDAHYPIQMAGSLLEFP